MMALVVAGGLTSGSKALHVALTPTTSTTATRTAVTATAAADAYSRLPMSFEANQGQADPSVKFLATHGSFSVALTAAGVVTTVTMWPAASAAGSGSVPTATSTVVGTRWVGADPGAQVTGVDKLPGTVRAFEGISRTDPVQGRGSTV